MICNTCKKDLPTSKFSKYTYSQKLMKKCIRCMRVRSSQLREKRRKIVGSNDWFRAKYEKTKHRAKIYNISFSITLDDYKELFAVQACGYCGVHVNQTKPLQVDRIIPDKGYVKGNLRLACWLCNNYKQTMTKEKIHQDIQKLENKLNLLRSIEMVL